MGWLWGSGSAPAADAQTSQPPAAQPSPSAASAPSSTPPPAQPSLSRDEQAEAELQSFLTSLEAESKPASKPRFQRTPRPSPSNPNATITAPSNEEEPLSEQLLPRDMSCRQAFDNAFYCQSLGGQFNNLYRYGNMRNCKELWSDFWFCMKTKSYTDEERAEMIKTRYRSKLDKYRTGPSSEDVWKSRERKMEWGEAFSIPVDSVPESE